MKVAIIHYWFLTRRGGEKVVESILKIFPLYPKGIASLKLKEEYDLIISSESGPAKGVQITNDAPHICYIHSPMRYCWSHTDMYVQSVNPLLRPLMRFFFNRLKKWDTTTIDNVDLYIANSNNVANRVQKYYNRKAVVVHPPIEEHLFEKPLQASTKQVYVSFGAITPYKKIDLLVEAFNKNGKPLIIIGKGSERDKLIKKAKSNIEFKIYPNWKDIEHTFYKSKALLFPGEEDFGMIPLEIMAYGIPVIAYKKGGALETVVENKNNIATSTGIFFEQQTATSLNKAINLFEQKEKLFNAEFIRNHAKKFKESEFIKKFKNQLKNYNQTNE